MKLPAIPEHDTSPNNSTHNTPLKPSALRPYLHLSKCEEEAPFRLVNTQ